MRWSQYLRSVPLWRVINKASITNADVYTHTGEVTFPKCGVNIAVTEHHN